MGVVVGQVLLQHNGEVARSGDQEVVEAFAAQRADEAFRDRVRARRSNRGADDPNVGADEYSVEGGGELGIAIADQEPEPVGVVAKVHEQVASLLGDPAGGVGADPGEVHTAAAVSGATDASTASSSDSATASPPPPSGRSSTPPASTPLRSGPDPPGDNS